MFEYHDYYMNIRNDRIKYRQCVECGYNEIIKGDITIDTIYDYEQRMIKKTLSLLCKKCLIKEIDKETNNLIDAIKGYEESITEAKNAIDNNNKIKIYNI